MRPWVQFSAPKIKNKKTTVKWRDLLWCLFASQIPWLGDYSMKEVPKEQQ
jgi:hypothetical protein